MLNIGKMRSQCDFSFGGGAQCKATCRFGFTLAEVLITLGIIGVVAAMTMPTLMNQTNGAQYKAAIKKSLSAISQAVTLSVALNDISFADTTEESGTTSTTAKRNVADILRTNMKVIKSTDSVDYDFPDNFGLFLYDCGDECGPDDAVYVLVDRFLYFNDGSIFAIQSGDKNCTKDEPCFGVIDVNGKKGPNKRISCDGATSFDTCVVSNPTDIYTVVYYDQTILPAEASGKAVLYGK